LNTRKSFMTNMDSSRPICPVCDVCGGCTFQGIPYAKQLEEKLEASKEEFIKNEIDVSILGPMIPSPQMYGYRNKMEYTFGDEVKGGPMNLGMHKKGSFISIINSGMCQLVPEDFNTVLNLTRDWCNSKGYVFYHKKRHDGLLRSLIVRKGIRTNELLINIVTSSDGDFDDEGFVKLLLGAKLDSSIVGILHTYNDNVADSLKVDDMKILYGRDYYMEEILGLKFKVSELSFFQSNVLAAERLYLDALNLLPDINGKIVYDLYCGTGTISQAMALKAKEVYGVEIVEDAVESAKINAELNGLKNCHFICGDVLNVLDEIETKPDVIVVDPPRAGIHPKAMKKICSYDIPEIIYISCNPKTLAVNLASAKQFGYETKYLKCFDNFSFTKHVETVALLSR